MRRGRNLHPVAPIVHCCVSFCHFRTFFSHRTQNRNVIYFTAEVKVKVEPFCSSKGVCVSPQVEPSKPAYGMPPSGSAAAPPPSSTPAYMFSHQYQRECFSHTRALALEKYLTLNLPKNKLFVTKPFVFISLSIFAFITDTRLFYVTHLYLDVFQ